VHISNAFYLFAEEYPGSHVLCHPLTSRTRPATTELSRNKASLANEAGREENGSGLSHSSPKPEMMACQMIPSPFSEESHEEGDLIKNQKNMTLWLNLRWENTESVTERKTRKTLGGLRLRLRRGSDNRRGSTACLASVHGEKPRVGIVD
jgi:hypothetical protein